MRPLADARGCNRSHDRQGVVFGGLPIGCNSQDVSKPCVGLLYPCVELGPGQREERTVPEYLHILEWSPRVARAQRRGLPDGAPNLCCGDEALGEAEAEVWRAVEEGNLKETEIGSDLVAGVLEGAAAEGADLLGGVRALDELPDVADHIAGAGRGWRRQGSALLRRCP